MMSEIQEILNHPDTSPNSDLEQQLLDYFQIDARIRNELVDDVTAVYLAYQMLTILHQKTGVQDNPQLQNVMKKFHDTAVRMESKLMNAAAYHRLALGAELEKTTTFDMNSVLAESITNVRRKLSEEKKLQVDIFPEILNGYWLYMTGDKDRMDQALQNFIMSAVNRIKGEGTVRVQLGVTYRDEKITICITIADNGVPLSTDFTKVSPYKQPGTDVSTDILLATSIKIIDRHQGSVAIETGLIAGSVVRMYLPLLYSQTTDS